MGGRFMAPWGCIVNQDPIRVINNVAIFREMMRARTNRLQREQHNGIHLRKFRDVNRISVATGDRRAPAVIPAGPARCRTESTNTR